MKRVTITFQVDSMTTELSLQSAINAFIQAAAIHPNNPNTVDTAAHLASVIYGGSVTVVEAGVK